MNPQNVPQEPQQAPPQDINQTQIQTQPLSQPVQDVLVKKSKRFAITAFIFSISAAALPWLVMLIFGIAYAGSDSNTAGAAGWGLLLILAAVFIFIVPIASLVAIILSIISLASKNRGGTALAVSALVITVLNAIVALVLISIYRN